jgi:hypothetical protein
MNYLLLKRALESGLEYASEALVRHDLELGRTTQKNQETADQIVKDIEEIKATLVELEMERFK